MVAALTNADHVIVKLPRGSRTTTGRLGSTSSDVRVDCTGTSRPYEVWVVCRSRSALGSASGGRVPGCCSCGGGR
ncbi:hypothetical protein GS421_08415 [Rhodococcus hoagii]|nr:hypothetical protein [Prescottella equi]